MDIIYYPNDTISKSNEAQGLRVALLLGSQAISTGPASLMVDAERNFAIERPDQRLRMMKIIYGHYQLKTHLEAIELLETGLQLVKREKRISKDTLVFRKKTLIQIDRMYESFKAWCLQNMEDYGLSELDKLNTPTETLLRFSERVDEKAANESGDQQADSMYLLDGWAASDPSPETGWERWGSLPDLTPLAPEEIRLLRKQLKAEREAFWTAGQESLAMPATFKTNLLPAARQLGQAFRENKILKAHFEAGPDTLSSLELGQGPFNGAERGLLVQISGTHKVSCIKKSINN